MGAKIYNSNLTKEIIDGAKLQVQDGNIPSEIGNTVVPVMEVNPRALAKVKIGKGVLSGATGATTSTIYTVPTGKKLYITNASLGVIKDAACDVASGTYGIVCNIDGQSIGILRIPLLTLTAQNSLQEASFPFPIEVDEGTMIVASAFAFTAGNSYRYASFLGYLIDKTQN